MKLPAQGYTGLLDSLSHHLYMVVYNDNGSITVAFGRLEMSHDRQPVPVGTWMLDGWYAMGFARKSGDQPLIHLRVRQAPGMPTPTSSRDVTWFMPTPLVEDDRDVKEEARLWAAFREHMPAELRTKVDQVTLGQPFGGVSNHVLVNVDDTLSALRVDGMIVGAHRFAYQIGGGQYLKNRPGEVAALQCGWVEKDRCQVVFRYRALESIDAGFMLG